MKDLRKSWWPFFSITNYDKSRHVSPFRRRLWSNCVKLSGGSHILLSLLDLVSKRSWQCGKRAVQPGELLHCLENFKNTLTLLRFGGSHVSPGGDWNTSTSVSVTPDRSRCDPTRCGTWNVCVNRGAHKRKPTIWFPLLCSSIYGINKALYKPINALVSQILAMCLWILLPKAKLCQNEVSASKHAVPPLASLDRTLACSILCLVMSSRPDCITIVIIRSDGHKGIRVNYSNKLA